MAQSEAERRTEAAKRKSEAPVEHIKGFFNRIRERPLLSIGLLGIFFLFFGVLLIFYQNIYYNMTHRLSVHSMIAVQWLSIVGVTFVMVALILYALKMLKNKIAGKER